MWADGDLDVLSLPGSMMLNAFPMIWTSVSWIVLNYYELLYMRQKVLQPHLFQFISACIDHPTFTPAIFQKNAKRTAYGLGVNVHLCNRCLLSKVFKRVPVLHLYDEVRIQHTNLPMVKPNDSWNVTISIRDVTRWWFQIFCIFTPTWGNDPIWLAYFSTGLKPPTR